MNEDRYTIDQRFANLTASVIFCRMDILETAFDIGKYFDKLSKEDLDKINSLKQVHRNKCECMRR